MALSEDDKATLAELLRSPFWGRVERAALAGTIHDPRVSLKPAADQALGFAFNQGMQSFPEKLRELSLPPRPTRNPANLPLIRKKRGQKDTLFEE